MSRVDEVLMEFGGYTEGATNNFDKAKTTLLNDMLAMLPEEATETRSLGKDYSGYSRGYNQAIDELRAKIQEYFNGSGE